MDSPAGEEDRLRQDVLAGRLRWRLAHDRCRRQRRAAQFHAVEPDAHLREGEGPHRAAAIELWPGQRHQCAPGRAIFAGQNASHRDAAAAGERDGPGREGARELELQPGRAAAFGSRESEGRVQVVVQQRRRVERPRVRRRPWMGLDHGGLVGRRPEGNDGGVAVVRGVGWHAGATATRREIPDWTVVRRRRRQLLRETARAGHDRLTPHELLHRLLGLHPRPAGLGPAWRAEDRHFQPEPIGLRRRVAHRVQPLRSPEPDLAFDGLACAGADIRQLEPADADALHPLEVLRDAFPRDVAAGPVPPGPRPGRVRRTLEALLERVASLANDCRGGEREEHCEAAHPDNGPTPSRRGRPSVSRILVHDTAPSKLPESVHSAAPATRPR